IVCAFARRVALQAAVSPDAADFGGQRRRHACQNPNMKSGGRVLPLFYEYRRKILFFSQIALLFLHTYGIMQNGRERLCRLFQ
ncbi:MAG: hypothetical protein IIX15_02710, partial [Clostridia bacterium]|nr:hypothetical protein [Clostridia bacterium]